jgi:hypothetical protein
MATILLITTVPASMGELQERENTVGNDNAELLEKWSLLHPLGGGVCLVFLYTVMDPSGKHLDDDPSL